MDGWMGAQKGSDEEDGSTMSLAFTAQLTPQNVFHRFSHLASFLMNNFASRPRGLSTAGDLSSDAKDIPVPVSRDSFGHNRYKS